MGGNDLVRPCRTLPDPAVQGSLVPGAARFVAVADPLLHSIPSFTHPPEAEAQATHRHEQTPIETIVNIASDSWCDSAQLCARHNSDPDGSPQAPAAQSSA